MCVRSDLIKLFIGQDCRVLEILCGLAELEQKYGIDLYFSHHLICGGFSCGLSVSLHQIVSSMDPGLILRSAVTPVPGTRKGSRSVGEYTTRSFSTNGSRLYTPFCTLPSLSSAVFLKLCFVRSDESVLLSNQLQRMCIHDEEAP